MSDLLAAVEQEIAEIEESLRADPRQQKLKALRELKALYRSTDGSKDVSQAAAPRFVLRRTAAGAVRERMRPDRQRLLDEVEKILDTFGPGPTKTSDIFGILPQEIVATIGGTDARNNLSAIIHNSGRFQSHGRGGWSLKPKEGEPPVVEDLV